MVLKILFYIGHQSHFQIALLKKKQSDDFISLISRKIE